MDLFFFVDLWYFNSFANDTCVFHPLKEYFHSVAWGLLLKEDLNTSSTTQQKNDIALLNEKQKKFNQYKYMHVPNAFIL